MIVKTYQLEKINNNKSSFYLLYGENEGYKKCEKNLSVQSPSVDLVDGYFQIFNHRIG